MLQTGQPNVAPKQRNHKLMFSGIVISRQALHLDLYIASASSSLMVHATDKRIELCIMTWIDRFSLHQSQ